MMSKENQMDDELVKIEIDFVRDVLEDVQLNSEAVLSFMKGFIDLFREDVIAPSGELHLNSKEALSFLDALDTLNRAASQNYIMVSTAIEHFKNIK